MSTYRVSTGPRASSPRPRGGLFAGALALALAAAAHPSGARAQSSDERPAPRREGEARGDNRPAVSTTRPFMMNDGAAITDVADALDVGSTWSFRLGATFVHSRRTSLLQRELSPSTALDPAELEDATAGSRQIPYANVARYSHVVNRLDVNAELALYQDIALFFGLPVILSDDRSLRAEGNVDNANRRLRDGYTVNGSASQLFTLPTMGEFNSPTRAGIDYVRLGLRLNVLNQTRDRHLPSWLIQFEWRPPVGPSMTPCYMPSGGTAPVCPADRPHDYAYNFNPDGSNNLTNPDFDRPTPAGRNPGISRGVHGLYFLTALSRRMGFIEPYGALEALVELPAAGNTAFRFGEQRPFGQVTSMPPIQGALMAGVEIYPWENRELWQRFGIDLRVRAAYHSPGRDLTALYDALGSSNSYALSAPAWPINYAYRNPGDPNPLGDPTKVIYFSGTTTEQAHARIGAQLGLSFIITRWIRVALGSSVTYITPHLLTATDACNPNDRPSEFTAVPEGDRGSLRGGCIGDASPDPQHRAAIDLPGQRFRMVEDMMFDLWANVTLTPRF